MDNLCGHSGSCELAPRRNTFTVSHAGAQLSAEERAARSSRGDYEAQRLALQLDRDAKLQDFIARHEGRQQIPPRDRKTALRWLLLMAARRDVALLRRQPYDASTRSLIVETWQALIKQFDNFFMFADTDEALAAQCTAALENISSIGVWFNGPNLSPPLRQYTMEVPAPDGSVETMVVMGLVSFAYSSYIMQYRQASQMHLLGQLQALQQELGETCLFLPPLLVSTTDDCRA